MTVAQRSRLWFPFGVGPEQAQSRLFCLPFAGGGASNFLAWRSSFPAVGVAPVQYPGHETRLAEAPLQTLEQMLDGLAQALQPLLDRPYALFGYSMGARLAFALTQRLQALGLPLPQALLLAAHAPPNRPSPALRAVGLDDAAFKAMLCAYGGIPAELSSQDDFWNMSLPSLRADFALAAQAVDQAPLPCPIFAYAGVDDEAAGPDVMAGWAQFTHSRFRLRSFAGGHFFLRSAADLVDAIRADLAQLEWAPTERRACLATS